MRKVLICGLLALIISLSACVQAMPNVPPSKDTPSATPIVSEVPEVNETPTPMPANDTPEPVDISVSEYVAIIRCYRDYAQHEDTDALYDAIMKVLLISPETDQYGLSPSCGELHFVNIEGLTYSIHDINGDGVDELIILSEDYFIHAVYTLDGDAPVLLGAYWSRKRCVIDEAGTLYVNGSGGAADSYSASYIIVSETASLSMIEMVGVESYYGEASESHAEVRFYHVIDGVETIISDEEATAIWERFPDIFPDNPTKNIGLVLAYFSK